MTNAISLNTNGFAVTLPSDAPQLDVDFSAPTLSWRDIYPDNYWNKDLLREKQQQLGGNPVYTVKAVVVKPVVNPDDAIPDLTPKIVVQFHETPVELVCNKTRCLLFSKLAQTRDMRHWAANLADQPLELYIGEFSDMSASNQILIRLAPDVETAVSVATINNDLFG